MANSGMLMLSISLFSTMIISQDSLLFSNTNRDGFTSHDLLQFSIYNNISIVTEARADPTLIPLCQTIID
jgi:hypothetical protein